MASSVPEVDHDLRENHINQYKQFVNYLNVACVCLWGYDYALTFSLEVSLFWLAPWRALKVLFLLTRYLPFVTAGLGLYFEFGHGTDPKTCLLIYKLIACADESWLIFISLGISELILTIRTWTLWGRNRKVGIILFLFFAVIWAFVFMNLQHLEKATASKTNSCTVTDPHRTHTGTIIWSLLTGFQFVALVLMLIKGCQSFKLDLNRDSDLYRIVYMHGILYYLYLFVLSGITLIILLASSKNFIIAIRHTMQSLLTCRMLFELRQCGKQSFNGDVSSEASRPIFKQPGALVGSGSSQTLHVELHTHRLNATGGAHESKKIFMVSEVSDDIV